MNPNSKFIFLNEYGKDCISEFPKEAVEQLVQDDLCTVIGNNITFKVVGVLSHRDYLIIVFPKNHSIPKDFESRKKHSSILIQTLYKYRKENELDDKEQELMSGKSGEYKNSIQVAMELITDYLENGKINKKTRVKSDNPNNISWPATIKKKEPVFSENYPIYSEVISEKTISDRQNLLTQLHSYCLYSSLLNYDWLFNLSINDFDLNKCELPCSLEYAINYLDNELTSTFIEREVNVIKLIRDYLIGISFNVKNDLDIFATPYFQNVWEAICSEIFNNQYKELKPIIPRIRWNIGSSSQVQIQKPDILSIKKDVLFILDAKYYDISNNLPGGPDVVKQLFYAHSISESIKNNNFILNKKADRAIKRVLDIENIFIFPGNDVKAIKRVGEVNLESLNIFKNIVAYEVNTLLSMECYLGRSQYGFIQAIKDDA